MTPSMVVMAVALSCDASGGLQGGAVVMKRNVGDQALQVVPHCTLAWNSYSVEALSPLMSAKAVAVAAMSVQVEEPRTR